MSRDQAYQDLAHLPELQDQEAPDLAAQCYLDLAKPKVATVEFSSEKIENFSYLRATEKEVDYSRVRSLRIQNKLPNPLSTQDLKRADPCPLAPVKRKIRNPERRMAATETLRFMAHRS